MSFWLVDNFCNISYIAWKFCILSNEWIERNTLTFIFKPINSHIYYYFLCFSSLTDDYKSRPISDEAAITFNVVDLGTQRGKRKLVSSDGFTFTFKRQNKNSIDWRCRVRNKTISCPVVVRQQGDSFDVLNNKTHTHAAQPDVLTAVNIRKQVSDIICFY